MFNYSQNNDEVSNEILICLFWSFFLFVSPLVHSILAVVIVLYSIAVMRYVSMKQKKRRQILEIQRFDQVFILAPVDYKTFEV